MIRFAAVEMVPEAETTLLLAAPIAASESADKNTMNVAVEVALPDGTQVRVAHDATAKLLADVFVALDRR